MSKFRGQDPLYRLACLYRRKVLREYAGLAERDTELCIEGYHFQWQYLRRADDL